jgi:hypothetical protein
VSFEEPPDGTKLIIDQGDGDWKVIWRDDAEADRWYDGDARGQHWWDDAESDPMGLEQQTKYADAVYRLGDQVVITA